jgi:hypothetical protein
VHLPRIALRGVTGRDRAWRSSRAVALIWWSFDDCRVRSVRSAAGLAAKRTPVPGRAVGAVDLSGVLATAGRVHLRLLGALASSASRNLRFISSPEPSPAGAASAMQTSSRTATYTASHM